MDVSLAWIYPWICPPTLTLHQPVSQPTGGWPGGKRPQPCYVPPHRIPSPIPARLARLAHLYAHEARRNQPGGVQQRWPSSDITICHGRHESHIDDGQVKQDADDAQTMRRRRRSSPHRRQAHVTALETGEGLCYFSFFEFSSLALQVQRSISFPSTSSPVAAWGCAAARGQENPYSASMPYCHAIHALNQGVKTTGCDICESLEDFWVCTTASTHSFTRHSDVFSTTPHPNMFSAPQRRATSRTRRRFSLSRHTILTPTVPRLYSLSSLAA